MINRKCVKCSENGIKRKKCKHFYCNDCHFSLIRKAIFENNDFKVKCSVSECKQPATDDEIRKYLSDKEINEMEMLTIKRNNEKDVFKCYNEMCQEYIANFNKIDHIFCESCKMLNCKKHKILHPENECAPKNEIKVINQSYLKKQRRNALIDLDNENYIPNPEASECQICCSIILPRDGIRLRNCLDDLHKKCLKSYLEDSNTNIPPGCPICNERVDERDLAQMISVEKRIESIYRLNVKDYSKCLNANCPNLWLTDKTSVTCDLCNSVNCLKCNDLHEPTQCESKKKQIELEKDLILKYDSVKCYRCNYLLVKERGCNAMTCPKCRCSTCLFTGLKAGLGGCGCSTKKLCHKFCQFGCFTE